MRHQRRNGWSHYAPVDGVGVAEQRRAVAACHHGLQQLCAAGQQTAQHGIPRTDDIGLRGIEAQQLAHAGNESFGRDGTFFHLIEDWVLHRLGEHDRFAPGVAGQLVEGNRGGRIIHRVKDTAQVEQHVADAGIL